MARLVLCVLLAGILLGVPTLAAPLEVVTISPSGKVAQAGQVAIVFSEPMVPLGVVEAPEPPAILSPQPAGKWRWVDPRTLVFETPERLPQGTFYTVKVPAGVKSSSGSVLAELVAGRFEAPGPTMLNPLRGERIRGLPPGGRKVITLSFDQPVDSKEVVEHVRLVGGGKEYRTSLAPDPDDGQAHAQEVHLRPLDPLAPSMEFRLVLDAGVRSKEGPLISKRQEVTFMTPPPLSFTLDRAHPRRVDIDSSNPLDEASLDSTPRYSRATGSQP